MTLKERYKGIIDYFLEAMPEPKTELDYGTTYQLLVSVILSAQCTDKRINMVTPALFQAFPTVADLAKAETADILPYIKSVTFPNNKSRSLQRMARKVVEEHGGEIPRSFDDLMELPGVGRKTANVVLSVVYGDAVMAVDTHVFRVSERLGLTTRSKNPLQTERALMKHIPVDLVPRAHHWLILHGRYVCKARRPDCLNCGLTRWCRMYNKELKNPPK